jgi:hypothetical protein
VDGRTGSPIGSDNDSIFLVALLESDAEANSLAVYDNVRSLLRTKLQDYKQAGMSRATMVSSLRADMDAGIDAARDDRGDADDRVGGIYEILWGASALDAARAGKAVNKAIYPVGSGSKYTLLFQLR